MATLVTTTLTKRTGATTTVFTPGSLSGGVGWLYAPGTLAGFSPQLTMQAVRTNAGRRTSIRATVPQLAQDGLTVRSRPWGQIELWVPDGTVQTDVNDLVGYLNALSASGLANANDLLVNGAGVF